MTAIQIKKDRLQNWLLWWSANGGYTWFPINERNVIPIPDGDPDPFKAYAAHRQAMNRVYAGSTETFEGFYDKASKKLKVKALSRIATIIQK